MKIIAGHIITQSLKAHEVERVFCVPGESYLPVLDGLVDTPSIETITCRHESGASFMAEAYAHLTGKPGVVMATRGPGACNASIGIHTAMQSSAPIVFLVGLIHSATRDREAFQEFDIAQMFGSLSKWASVIDDPARIGEYMARAFHVATSGRPGPVVLGLPEDVLFPEIKAHETPVLKTHAPQISQESLSKFTGLLGEAKTPIIIAGGSMWNEEDTANLQTFAENAGLPVATSFRRQDLFNHDHPNYIGELGTGPNPALVKRVQSADLVIAIGARLNEMAAQEYELIKTQKLIHIYPDESAFGKPSIPELALCGDLSQFLSALAQVKIEAQKWHAWSAEARQDYEIWSAIDTDQVRDLKGADMTQVFAQIRDLLPDDAVVTTDAGNFSGWAQRYLRYGRPGRLLAPISGAMGYAVPSAVSASIQHPGRVVLGLCGDGGFMMSAPEMATAVMNGAAPIIIVFNNAIYGTIRMHQDRHYPDRPSATDLVNPDFAAMAQSFGAFSARITHADQFAAVWQEAQSSGRLALIEVQMDPRQISTQTSL